MQQGGSPYGAPPPPAPAPAVNSSSYEELGAAVGDNILGGGDVGGGGGLGNRWPRQETLALLKIRSEMDAAFKDATLKGPLWEEVSRKLAELGYKRSGKKCKEKFENVHKYYKRTKEGRAGRQDGKSYRFFTQLEALHTTTAAAAAAATAAVSMPATTTTTISIPANFQISAPTPITTAPPPFFPTGISFSSNTSSSSFGSESEEEDDEATEEGPMKESGGGGKKRKRDEKESKKMMAFFEGMMRQVMERQEAMQKKFLEAIEKREQDKMIREEAWHRQEVSRAAREHELAAQERAAAASRDAAIISFLQKVTGQSVPMPVPVPVPASPVTPPAPPVNNKPKSKPVVKENAEIVFQQQQQQQQHQQTPSSAELVPITSSVEGAGAVAGPSSVDLASSSRWPKSEVHALINLRSELDSRYQESGPKGPLWEEISAGMKRLGYNRNAKRCKEKWENINKYFKKVKESHKKRPEDAKTCPYFHQLDALYRRKQGSSGNTSATPISIISSPPPAPQPAPQSQSQSQPQQTNNTGNIENAEAGNGGIGSSYGDDGSILKKPEDIVKELMGQSTTTTIDYGKLDVDSDNMDEDDDDEADDDDDNNGDGKYRIQFQRPNVTTNNSNGDGGGGGATTNSSNSTGGKTSGSFLAMVR